MILHQAKLIGEEGLRTIRIEGDRISAIADSKQELPMSKNENVVGLNGATVIPGLINSHDHLDFNLFPAMRNQIYKNYTEWGNDIHTEDKELISQVLKLPHALRVKWGIYKNLLNGFTTVVNHGEKLEIEDPLINVFQDCHILHSPAFEKNWKWKLNDPFKKAKPFVMHLGEGTDAAATKEIDTVKKFNYFKRNIVAVHGVGMTETQAPFFHGLVWCPASNYFLLDQTAPIDKLKSKIKIVFGTDSTLTSVWNAWEHFRLAMKSGMFSEEELVNALTKNAATLWKLQGAGAIKEKNMADLLVVKKSENLFDQDPQDILLVIQNGKPRMIDETLFPYFDNVTNTGFSTIRINNVVKKVEGNLSRLVGDIRKYFPAAIIPFQF